MIIDGKKIAESLLHNIKQEIIENNIKAKMAVILVGNNPSSEKYVEQKSKRANELGIDFELIRLEGDVPENKLIDMIDKMNNDISINGFIIQLPLPNHINQNKIIKLISPNKDIDGFSPVNIGKMSIGLKQQDYLAPCTPSGVMYILENLNVDLKGKNITIIGRSNIVGKPLANMLINAQATVTVCNSQTKNIEFFTRNSHIIILALGKAKFLKRNMIKAGSIIIDVGFTFLDGKIYGDADIENLHDICDITPVPGGVGALTVAMLMNNTIKAYKKQKN